MASPQNQRDQGQPQSHNKDGLRAAQVAHAQHQDAQVQDGKEEGHQEEGFIARRGGNTGRFSPEPYELLLASLG
jgi:hypothetical protein